MSDDIPAIVNPPSDHPLMDAGGGDLVSVAVREVMVSWAAISASMRELRAAAAENVAIAAAQYGHGSAEHEHAHAILMRMSAVHMAAHARASAASAAVAVQIRKHQADVDSLAAVTDADHAAAVSRGDVAVAREIWRVGMAKVDVLEQRCRAAVLERLADARFEEPVR